MPQELRIGSIYNEFKPGRGAEKDKQAFLKIKRNHNENHEQFQVEIRFEVGMAPQ